MRSGLLVAIAVALIAAALLPVSRHGSRRVPPALSAPHRIVAEPERSAPVHSCLYSRVEPLPEPAEPAPDRAPGAASGKGSIRVHVPDGELDVELLDAHGDEVPPNPEEAGIVFDAAFRDAQYRPMMWNTRAAFSSGSVMLLGNRQVYERHAHEPGAYLLRCEDQDACIELPVEIHAGKLTEVWLPGAKR
jgi:hypothetical protein